MKQDYIGTISITPRVTVFLDEGVLKIHSGAQTVTMLPSSVISLIEDLRRLDYSKQQGVRVDGIPIPWDRVKAAINVLLRGLEKMDIDTSEIKKKQWEEERKVWDKEEGMVPEQAEEVGGEGI